MTSTTWALVPLAVLLVACGADGSGGFGTSADGISTPSAATEALTTSPTAAEPPSESPMPESSETATEDVLDTTLTFEQAGGWVPLERLDIEPDGQAVLVSGGHEPVEFTVPEAELRTIADALGGLADEAPDQMSDPPVVDATNWGIAYGDVDIVADAEAVSDSLRPLVERLQALLEEHRPAS